MTSIGDRGSADKFAVKYADHGPLGLELIRHSASSHKPRFDSGLRVLAGAS